MGFGLSENNFFSPQNYANGHPGDLDQNATDIWSVTRKMGG